jgi:hypothetical protein
MRARIELRSKVNCHVGSNGCYLRLSVRTLPARPAYINSRG